MNPDSFLLTVAQVGVALAGFSALISAFRREGSPLTPTEIMGRTMILEMGLAATLFALIPFPVESLLSLFNTIGVWRVSSLLMVVFLTGWGFYHASRTYNLIRTDQFIERMQGIFNILLILLNVVLVIVSALLVLNVIFFGSASFYMIGLLWMLAVAGAQFMIFVAQYAREYRQS